jgi:hypothetical protein
VLQDDVDVFRRPGAIAQAKLEGNPSLDDEPGLPAGSRAFERARHDHIRNPAADPAFAEAGLAGVGLHVFCEDTRRGR